MAVCEDQFATGRIFSAALAAVALLGGCSDGPGNPRIAVENGWTRETAPGQTAAAVYLTISNDGGAADRLVGASSATAAAASLHSSSSEGGVARMRPVDDGVEIPAGARVELKPAGTHIMVSGLNKRLQAGDTLELRLQFDRSGQRRVSVRAVSASAADGHPQHRAGR